MYATEFLREVYQNDPTWLDRLDAASLTKFNGHFKVWLYATGGHESFFGGYIPVKVSVYKIEGVPTQEEIDASVAADEAAAEAERIAKEEARIAEKEAEKKAKLEEIERLNAVGKSLAQDYTFHGIEEVEVSRKLFANGALEPGHAYLISGFVVQYGGSYAAIEYGDGFFFSSRSSSVIVSYASQKVKAEIINAGVTSVLGKTIETPLTVVVAAGSGYSGTPVVLGLIE